MSVNCCCSKGLEISNNFYAPDLFLMEKYKWTRLAKVPLALFTGLVKPFLFPVWVLVGIVILPIIAIIRACKGERDLLPHKTSDYLKAWSFSLLGLAGIVTVMALTSTVIPLLGTGTILLGAFIVSVSFHLYRGSRPNQPQSLPD